MKNRFFTLRAFGLLAAFAVLSFAACSGKKGSSALPDVIKIGTQQIPNGETIVKLNNLFDELEVKVNLVEFDSGKDVIAALASKSIDIGMLGSTPATTGISTGVPVELFWIHDVIGKAESLVVKGNSGINGLQDLAGKKIATPFGSTAHYSILNALKLEGIAAKDVTILDLQPADIYAAWQRGDIDGAYVWHPTLSRLQAEGGRVIITSEDLAGRGIITADIGVVRTDFGQRYPELVANYIRLQGRAVGIYKNNFPEAVRLVARAYDISNEESEQQITELIWLTPEEHLSQRYLGTSSQKGDIANTLKSTSEFLVDQGLIERSPDISVFRNAVNPSYIEAALR
jgi:taurine transport system substrate-binding protein